MKKIKTLILAGFIVLSLNAFAQKNKSANSKTDSKQKLKSTLSNKTVHNVIDNKTIIIKDSIAAIKIAETILFDLYGEDKIIKQRPYETSFTDNYWVISGTLPKGQLGGTFLIVIDAKDCKIIRITHGK